MTIEAYFHVDRGGFLLDVNLSLPSRGVTALFGPSGCGKTTILRAIAGLERHRVGYLKVDDALWQQGPFFLPPHQRSVGYVFQEASLFPHLNVRDNLRYAIKRVPATPRGSVSIDRASELLGIGPLLNRHDDQLSGGERQRVAIARAIAASPDLLLLDEPLASIDHSRKEEILPYIESLRKELDIPVIYVSHSPDEVARIADHLVYLENGKVLASGPVAAMLTRFDLPLSHGDNAEAIIEAIIMKHDADFHLTILDSPAGQFTVAHNNLEIGTPIRLRIYGRDVSITLDHQTNTSILNIFQATIDEISIENEAQAIVRLLAGEVFILSRVTRKSVVQLQLVKGLKVFIQIKSIAILA